MNEQRNMKKLYLSGDICSSFEHDWNDLLAKLQMLREKAKSVGRMDLIISIIRKENVLVKNKPNKKIYRSISKFADDIENQIEKTSERIRSF